MRVGKPNKLAPISPAAAPNTASITVNYTAPYAAGLTGTQYFQHWFRSGLATGTGSNTSDAVEIRF